MNMPFALVDQDDTLCDLSTKVHERFANVYGLDVPAFEFRNFYDMLNTVPGLTSEIMDDVFHSDVFENLTPNPGAVEALHEMDRMGLAVRICTKPIFTNFACVPAKKQWVKEHLGSAWLNRMIFTEDKTIIMGRYLIDDKPYIKGLNSEPVWTQVFFTQPYNANRPGLRLNSWADWKSVLQVPSTQQIIDLAR